MDAVVAELGSETVDFLKCDIEGAEREVFEAAGDWLAGIGVMSVECHSPFAPEELVDLLRARELSVDVLHRESAPAFGCETVLLRTGGQPSRSASTASTPMTVDGR
jgi:hypothetical protein